MRHIKTLFEGAFKPGAESCLGGCGECPSSCQSACKTSCTVANQKCEKIGAHLKVRAKKSN